MADTNESWVKTLLAGCLCISSSAAVELAKAAVSRTSAIETTAINVLGLAAGVTMSLAVSEIYAKVNTGRSNADLERNHHVRRAMARALRAALLRARDDESLATKAGAAMKTLFDAWPKLLEKADRDNAVLEILFPLNLSEDQWELLMTYAAGREVQWADLEETEAELIEGLNTRDAKALIEILNGVPRGLDANAAELPGRWSAKQAQEFALGFLPLYRMEFACTCVGDGVLGKAVQFKGITDIRSRLEAFERAWRSDVEKIKIHITLEAETNREHETAEHEKTREQVTNAFRKEIAPLAQAMQERRGGWGTDREHTYHLEEMEKLFGYEETIPRLAQQWLTGSEGRLLVYGPPCAGKSMVARAVLRFKSVEARFGARRFEIQCDDLSDFDQLAVRIAWVWFGIVAELPQVAFNLLNAELARKPCAVLLDNFETLLKGDPDTRRKSRQWLAQLGSAEGVRLMVAAQGMVPPEGMAWPLRYQPENLSVETCKNLFCEHSQVPDHARDLRLEGLIAAVQRIPLAVKLLGKAALDQVDLSSLQKRWEKRTVGTILKPGESRQECLDTAFEFAYAHLEPPMQRALRVLTWLPSGVAQEHLEAVLPGGLEADHALYAAGVAYREGELKRLTMLAPLREYMKIKHAASAEERLGAEAFYLWLATEIADPGAAVNAKQIRSLTEESANVQAALENALEAKRREAVTAARGLGRFSDVTGLGRATNAEMLQRAKALAKEYGDPLGEAWCLWSLSVCMQWWQRLDTQKLNYEAAKTLFEDEGNLRGKAWCLLGLGNVVGKQTPLLDPNDYIDYRYAARSLFAELAKDFVAAQSIFSDSQDSSGEAHCWLSLGNLALRLDLLLPAKKYNYNAKRLFARLGDQLNEASSLLQLGEVALKQTRWRTATTLYTRAKRYFGLFGDRYGEAACLFGLGQVTRRLRQSEAATDFYKSSLALAAAREDRGREAWCFCGLGDVAVDERDYRQAKAYYQTALDIFRLAGLSDEAERCELQLARLETHIHFESN